MIAELSIKIIDEAEETIKRANEELGIDYTVGDEIEIINDLLNKIEELRETIRDLRYPEENDYDPEREIPEIHGKGISY